MSRATDRLNPGLIAAALALTALGSAAPASAATAPKVTAKAAFSATGSVGEAYVTGAAAGDQLILVDSSNKVVTASPTDLATDSAGSKIFHNVKPGKNYTVRLSKGGKVYGTSKFAVLAKGQNPSASFYKNIHLHAGLNYVKVRDGVEIAMTVRLPLGAKTLDGASFPTFVEYSGYETASPHSLLETIPGLGTASTNDVLLPSSATSVGALIGPLLGFATVSVQMRGSGCSGGAFDLFGLPTSYDGYDAIEAVAAQPWVKNHKVGMGGISFSGISQLFVAGTQPPHLAAISPLSVMDDTYTATGYPGGIFNKGFALSWVTDRMNNAQPAPAGGQGWAKYLSSNDPATGQPRDAHCLANQNLRLQTIDAVQQSRDNPYRTPALFNDRAPASWMKSIKVPVFLVGQFQDEQTGGHFVESLSGLKNNKKVWISLQNGVHADSLGPSTMTRWVEFMNLYVANRIPKVSGLITSFSDSLYQQLADAPALPVAQSRFATMADTATNLIKARAEFEKDPRVRVLMDNGAAIPGQPGAIGAAWDLGFSAWPVANAAATTWYFGDGGALTKTKPTAESSVSYVSDPSARPKQTLASGGDAWKAQPNYDWAPVAAGKGLGFTSPVLTQDSVIVGSASADLWVQSSKADTDLQVGVSEVRPDGNETLVQNGWLRASHRKLDAAKSTALDPFPTHLQSDAANLPSGQYTLVRVPIYAFGHAFRAGSRIRITVMAPGGDRQIWDFGTLEDGTTTNTLSLGGTKPSAVVLPVIPAATAKGTSLPPATALRGEPNRTYVAATNGG